MSEGLLKGEQNAHEAFRQLTDLDQPDRQAIMAGLHTTKAQLDAIFFNDPAARTHTAAMAEGIAWQYWGELDRQLPGSFITANDGIRTLFAANGYMKRQIVVTFQPVIEDAQARFLRKALQPNQHEKIEALCQVLRHSPVYTLLTGFLENPHLRNRPLTAIEKMSTRANLEAQVAQKYQLTRSAQEGRVFAPHEQARIIAARRELQHQIMALDDHTRPARRSMTVQDPLQRARHFFAHYLLSSQFDTFDVKKIFVDIGELAYHADEEIGDFQLGFMQDYLAGALTVRDDDQLENYFAYEMIMQLFEPNLEALTPETIEQMTRSIANYLWTEYVQIQAGKHNIWEEQSISTKKLQPLFWLRRVCPPSTQDHDGSLVFAVPYDNYGQFPLVSREQFKKLARQRVGSITLDTRPSKEKYATPPRMLMGMEGTTIEDDLSVANEDPFLRLRITPEAYHAACGEQLPRIPGYRLLQFERNNDWYTISFAHSDEGDPYSGCEVVLDERAKANVLQVVRARKLEVLANALEATPHLTVGVLAGTIARCSLYHVPHNPVAGRGLKVMDGRGLLQCEGAANLLAEALNAGFGEQVAKTVGGKPLEPTLTAMNHAQVLFLHQEHYYLLDATPSGSGLEAGMRTFLSELGRSAFQLLRTHGKTQRPPGNPPLARIVEAPSSPEVPAQEVADEPVKYYFTHIREIFERHVRVIEQLGELPHDVVWQHIAVHCKKPGNPLYLTARHVMQAAPLLSEATVTAFSVEDVVEHQRKIQETINYLKNLDNAPLAVRTRYTLHKTLQPFIELLQQLEIEYGRLAANKLAKA